ncbi:MAG: hypothetical protein Q9171_004126 [Xanthocarpia ochracea]
MFSNNNRPAQTSNRSGQGRRKKTIQTGCGNKSWRSAMKTRRRWVAIEEKRMKWVQQQLPEVLSECATALSSDPRPYSEMVQRRKLNTLGVLDILVGTGGRPTRPIRPAPDSQGPDHVNHDLTALFHWEAECNQLEEDLWEWNRFLRYWRKKVGGETTAVEPTNQFHIRDVAQTDHWTEYQAFQQLNVDNAEQWVRLWEQQLEYLQDRENHWKL